MQSETPSTSKQLKRAMEDEAYKAKLLDPCNLTADIDAAVARFLAATAPTPPRGCSECGWGKVAGCWRCGSR